MTDKPRGPASYFPAIEAKYGRTIDEWLPVLGSTGLSSHMELVEHLKTEHGFGHGHAGALVHHYLGQGVQRPGKDDQIVGLFTAKKAHWRPVYDHISSAIDGLGDVQVLPKKGMVGFARAGAKGQFAVVAPSTPDQLDDELLARIAQAYEASA